MKKTKLYAILPLAAASLAFTGCNTTQTNTYKPSTNQTSVLGSRSSMVENQEDVFLAQRAKNLESKITTKNLNKTSDDVPTPTFFSYRDPAELNYGFSFDERIPFEDGEIDINEENDLISFVDSLTLPYLPDIGFLMEKGETISAKTENYTKISKSTSSGFKLDTDFDMWDPKDSSIELSKRFSDGTEITIGAHADDKEYATLKVDFDYETGVGYLTAPVIAVASIFNK